MDFLLIQVNSAAAVRTVASTIRGQFDITRGDPVVAVSLRRLIVPSGVIQLLGLGSADDLRRMLDPIPDVLVSEIPEWRALELLNSRSRPELPLERLDSGTPQTGKDYSWHLERCKFPEAWNQLSPGDFGSIDWGDVVVGQIDTGYRDHPALGFEAGNPSFVQVHKSRNYYPPEMPFGQSFTNSGLDPLLGGAFDGHGTRTGSVLAGHFVRSVPAAGQLNGYFGAAPKVPYIPVRISDSVVVSHVQQQLADALRYLVASGCSVVTLSMGFPDPGGLTVLPTLRGAINEAYERGVIFVCAAGNYVRSVVAPAARSRTIAIGGSTPDDVPWSGSSRGVEVDISAPAWPIYRASVDGRGRPIYGFGDGTSFATALTAGAAALWCAKHAATLAETYAQPWERVAAFKTLLKSTARPPAGWDTSRYGTGILDAEALLDAPLPANLVAEPTA